MLAERMAKLHAQIGRRLLTSQQEVARSAEASAEFERG
jgi:hypothetical protein